MKNLILVALAVLTLGACSNPASPLDTLIECDQYDRSAEVVDAELLTRCDGFDRSQPIN